MSMIPFSLEKYLANPARQVVTRDGKPVRILCVDAVGEYPIVALVKNENKEFANNFTKDGRLYKDSKDDRDLFFAPIKREGWTNIYKNTQGQLSTGIIYNTKEEALRVANHDSIATTKIEWEE